MILRLVFRLTALGLIATSLPLMVVFGLRAPTPDALLAAVRIQAGRGMYPYDIILRDASSAREWVVSQVSSGIIAWSPDGEKLAYVNYLPFSADLWDYYVLDFSTGERTHLLQSAIAYTPRWSPDSRWLLYH